MTRDGTSEAPRRRLGAGRSGTVYHEAGPEGARAVKVFDAGGLARWVQIVLLGAPNPYRWCEDAIEAAALRRRLLATLVRLWFGERLRVAAVHAVRWNEDERAWELHASFSPGRHAALRQPLREDAGELRELRRDILPLLQRRLREAGCTGALWQAGYGNPVAVNNFLLETGADGQRRWCWIDLESGVPALFPFGLRPLLGFYLPEALRRRRPLFDDVDTAVLRRWIEGHAKEIDERLGAGTSARLRQLAEQLEQRQRAWYARSRLRRSLEHALAQGALTPEAARWYAARPLRWYARLAAGELAGLAAHAGGAVIAGLRALARFDLPRWIRTGWGLLTSARRRTRFARAAVLRRVRAWRARGQLTREHARQLARAARTEDAAQHLSDLGMHLALKAPVKALEWWLLPVLYAGGWIGAATFAASLVLLGPLVRTLYTGWRCVAALRAAAPPPLLALALSPVPVLGNLAFALQLGWSSRRGDALLGRFLLYDAGARLGAAAPIWGGRDTACEHAANAAARWILPRREPRAVAQKVGERSGAVPQPTL